MRNNLHKHRRNLELASKIHICSVAPIDSKPIYIHCKEHPSLHEKFTASTTSHHVPKRNNYMCKKESAYTAMRFT